MNREKPQWRKKTIAFITLFLVFYNIVSTFSPYRNNYVLDAQDYVKRIDSNNQNICFIQDNNFKRFKDKSGDSRIKSIEVNKDFFIKEEFFEQYEWWKENGFLIIRIPNTDSFSIKKDLKEKYSIIGAFITNKKKTKNYYVIRIIKEAPLRLLSLYNHINSTEINEIISAGELKAYSDQYDIYIFKKDKELIWLVGTELKKKDELIFHLYTDKVDLLPEKRRQHKFDNRGFRFGIKPSHKIENYTIFRELIPIEYPITMTRVGLNIEGEITWKHYIDLNH